MDLEFRLDLHLAEALAPAHTLPADFKIKRAEFLKIAPHLAERLGQEEEWRDFLTAPEVQNGGLSWEKAWQFFGDGANTGDPSVDRLLMKYQNSCEHNADQGICLICHKPLQ